MNNEETIQAWAKARDYHVAVGPIALLDEVRSSLRKRRESGEIEDGFYRDNLDVFTYLEDVPLENPRSIILVAVSKPAHILVFTVGEKKIETILPPTYVRYRKTFGEVRDDLADALSSLGFRVELMNAPLKVLANRLGASLIRPEQCRLHHGSGKLFSTGRPRLRFAAG